MHSFGISKRPSRCSLLGIHVSTSPSGFIPPPAGFTPFWSQVFDLFGIVFCIVFDIDVASFLDPYLQLTNKVLTTPYQIR